MIDRGNLCQTHGIALDVTCTGLTLDQAMGQVHVGIGQPIGAALLVAGVLLVMSRA